MNENCENCIVGRPHIGRLAGVTRTMRLALYEGEGVPEGTPQDLTGLTVVVRVLRDGTNDIYTPGFVVEGTDSNVIKFTWPADQQAVGNYTIDVTMTDGSNNVNRVNWHGKDGIRLVEYSNQVYGDDATGAESSEAVGLVGYFTTNGVGMSAYEEWLASDESAGYPQTVAGFMTYLKQPATDAAAAAEATMTSIQSRADDDHTRAGQDHTTAESDHTRAGQDHTLAASDHTTAASDHTQAGNDHTRAESDHTLAAADHTTAAADHTLAASDHGTAASDHTRAGNDHTRAEGDHGTAADDHTLAAADHTTASTDHGTAAADHTTAGNDHTRANNDHGTAADDHTQAVADHAIVQGYDTRLTNVEGEVTQLGQEVSEKINDRTIVDTDASSLIDDWYVDGTVITFVASSGMDGTFTSHTAPSKPANTRPYFRFRQFVAGKKYRLRLKVTTASSTARGIGLFYAASQTESWSTAKLKDIYGNDAICYNGDSLDCIFEAVIGKTYIGFSADNFGINDTVTISNFDISEAEFITDEVAKAEIELSGLSQKIDKNYAQNRYVGYGKESGYHVRHIVDSSTPSPTGQRYSIILRVEQGSYISCQSSFGSGIFVAIYDTMEHALVGSSPLQSISSYSTQTIIGTTNYSGYLRVGTKKADGSSITDAEIEEFEASLSLAIVGSSIFNNIISEAVHFDSSKSIVQADNVKSALEGIQKLLFSSSFVFGKRLNNSGNEIDAIGFGYCTTSITCPQNFKIIFNTLQVGDGTAIICYNSNNQAFNYYSQTSAYREVSLPDQTVTFKFNFNIAHIQELSIVDSSGNNLLPEITSVLAANFVKYNDKGNLGVDNVQDAINSVVKVVRDMTAGQPETLPIGTFTNLTSKIVASDYVVCVPYIGVKYSFRLPDGVNACVVYGNSQTPSTTSGWVGNGGTIQLPNGTSYITQIIEFKLASGEDLAASTISDYVQSGDIVISYKRIDATISERNYVNENYIKAAVYRLVYQTSAERLAGSGIPSLPTFVHASDMHGDLKRFENVVQYANVLGANGIVVSGDNVMMVSSNGTGYMNDVISKYPSIPFLNCIGNHEAYPENTYDNEYLFENHISPFVEQGGYLSSSEVAATMPYYYVDFDNEKLRIITLNQYDNACYWGEGLGGRLGQTQVTWFCNTLLSTPEGYGVIIMMHSPEDKVDTPNEFSNWNQTINGNGRDEDEYGYAVNGLYVNSMRPIKTIIDAFISKTALSTTYAENTKNGNNGETVSISADFSEVTDGVEFVCYITGHRHKDNIGYVHSATNRQLMLNICCGNAHYPKYSGLSFSEGVDLPRGDRGITQDAFNVYGIDRPNGRVKIARVGSNVNLEGIDRKFLLAPYKFANHKVVQVLGAGASTSNTDLYTFTTVASGQDSFNTTITVSSSYTISSIVIKMGDVTLVENTDYTYDSSTGELSIPDVTDDLLITVSTISA